MSKSLYRQENQILIQLLKEARLKSGLSQVQCSERLQRPQSFISDVERGIRRLDLLQLHDFCEILGISLQALVAEFEHRIQQK